MPRDERRVAVIICAYTDRRWDSICAALSAIRSQVPPPDETVLVIDHANGLFERARETFDPAGVRVVANSANPGLSGARNTGVAATDAGVVVFLDDDATPRPGWLAGMVGPFADPAVAGVAGWVEPAWERGRPGWWPVTFDWVVGCSYEGLPGLGGEVRNPIGASMALDRERLCALGGFSEGLGRVRTDLAGCEETELCIRMATAEPGVRFVHRPEAVVDHLVPASRATPSYFLRRCWGEGRSKAVVRLLAGADRAVGPETRHATRTIPARAARDLLDLSRGLAGPSRSGAAAAGTLVAAAGYAEGRIRAVGNAPALARRRSARRAPALAGEGRS
jgi:GT2 family glycosyltransferase